ncbi:MAG: hypothetical protein ACE15E_13775 [Acidobacteriota bacterium]
MSKEPSAQGVLGKDAAVNVEITREMIHEALDRIVKSPAFAQSQRLTRFLRFVVEQALENKADQLKEYLIGIAVFDRNEGYDPRTDPIVRVEAGRLRTKLREYYSAEGREDPLLIELPKGSYMPAISLRRKELGVGRGPAGSRRPAALFVLLLIAGIAACALASFLYLQNRELRKAVQTMNRTPISPELLPLWGPFLSPGTDLYVVFGSPFFLTAPDYRVFLRAYDINEPNVNEPNALESNAAFQRLRKRLGPLMGPRYDYALVGETLALVRLTAFFAPSGVPVKAKESEKTNWDSIQTGNIILLGAPRMNHLLRRFPHSVDFEWTSDAVVTNRKPQPGEQETYTARFHEGYFDVNPASFQNAYTYVIVSSFPGFLPNREVLVLSAHGGPGVLGAIEYLTRAETVGPLLARMKPASTGQRQYFQLLVRVYVDRGVPIRTEYVAHHLKTYPPSEAQ